ncbi:MAG: hypothetical protein JNN12_00550 [Bacteroidetes Order II. Incertae sedis bacterium]|nr:hypothetical protein [Bacteroidetes Order II. bacterium]
MPVQTIREIVSPSLILFLLFQGSLSVWIQWDFLLRREFIAKNYCVNRANPNSDCQGRCYLGFRLNKTWDESGKKAPSQRVQEQGSWVYVAPFSAQLFAFHEVNGLKFPQCAPPERLGFLPDIEHPPQV